ncbi:hypothetical protein FE257_012699 [Aspergillus nanangensis]|uniref:BHLH domain-containing protein n=1 Tax=Aspergillus nanangensis TaxID=2582783 RepID=A0AAD4CG22_ASPNN|nr:hypothetical protein FE257_012699 [Aspergillus nanangensis]
MEQDPSLSWPEMASAGDDDFSNFLEFGMHFADLEGHGPTDQQNHQHPRSIAPSSCPTSTAPSAQEQPHLVRMDTDMVSSQPMSYNFPVELSNHPQAQSQQIPMSSPYTTAPMTPTFYSHKPSHPQLIQSHQLPSDHQHPTSQPYIPHGQHVIPPTPNSIELQGNAATYPQRVDESHEMYDRYARMSEEQALYTPLVSPAMTPLESQFRLPEYTIPGEYFTPLTSPALEAQNANSNGYHFQSNHVPDMGFAPSPVDIPSSPGLIRKHRRRPSTTTKTFSARAKKQQSPLVRPQTRKRSLLNVNSDEILNGLSQDQSKPRSAGSSGLRYGSTESSGQDSVSPEPLSEPLMPPPALPPARRSPAIAPQPAQSRTSEPATPAMLMRIQRSPHNAAITSNPATAIPTPTFTATETHDDVMEDVLLPEAATPTSHLPRPSMSRIDTSINMEDSSQTTTPASTTPALEPRSASAAERPPSTMAPSPRTIAMPSPSGPVGRKSDTPKLGPIGRKRQSLSSTHASPNLRPKISPSIQPLVRGDGLSGETSALYLASKSNYQHILDGTLLPGVSYPDTLAENLSSKRTNHKLAEQGRRNRINNALKEIETMIPPAFVQIKNAKESAATNTKNGEKEKASNQQISKASTVEMAIDYIKALQQELEMTRSKLMAAEARLAKEAESDAKSLVNKQVETAHETAVASTGPDANGST